MLKVGLTGGIGCGKSLVSDLFHNQFDIPIVDADIIAKQITQSRHVLDIISEEIGTEYIDSDNQLHRDKLRQAIFSNPDIRDKLESILHPLVYDEINKRLGKLDTNYCIVSIPLLLETKRTDFLDRILVVDCSVEEQITRVMARDHCTRAHVENIMATQIDRDSRLALADDIIENNSSIASAKNKVSTLHNKYIELSQSKKLS